MDVVYLISIGEHLLMQRWKKAYWKKWTFSLSRVPFIGYYILFFIQRSERS